MYFNVIIRRTISFLCVFLSVIFHAPSNAQEQKVIFCPDSVRGTGNIFTAQMCSIASGCQRDPECSMLDGSLWTIISTTQQEVPDSSNSCICIGSQYVIAKRNFSFESSSTSDSPSLLGDEFKSYSIWVAISAIIALSTTGYLFYLRHRQQFKKCPECAEKVRLDAIKCKHCGAVLRLSDLSEDDLTRPDSTAGNKTLRRIASSNVVIIMIFLFILLAPTSVKFAYSNIDGWIERFQFLGMDCEKLSGADYINCKARERSGN